MTSGLNEKYILLKHRNSFSASTCARNFIEIITYHLESQVIFLDLLSGIYFQNDFSKDVISKNTFNKEKHFSKFSELSPFQKRFCGLNSNENQNKSQNID